MELVVGRHLCWWVVSSDGRTDPELSLLMLTAALVVAVEVGQAVAGVDVSVIDCQAGTESPVVVGAVVEH